MTREEFVDELIEQAKPHWQRFWAEQPDEERLRLSGIETQLAEIGRALQRRLWELVGASMEAMAAELAGACSCGHQRERRKKSVTLDVLGQRVELPCSYFYCRRCKQGVSPVRRWLGLESGGVSLGFERAMTDLTTRMTFGDAVTSMQEQPAFTGARMFAERPVS